MSDEISTKSETWKSKKSAPKKIEYTGPVVYLVMRDGKVLRVFARRSDACTYARDKQGAEICEKPVL